jgi:hypothetical protein
VHFADLKQHSAAQGTGLLLEVARVELLITTSQLASRLQADLRILPITLALPSLDSPSEPAISHGTLCSSSTAAPAAAEAAPPAHLADAQRSGSGAVALASREASLAKAATSEKPLLEVSEVSIGTTLQLVGCACTVFSRPPVPCRQASCAF